MNNLTWSGAIEHHTVYSNTLSLIDELAKIDSRLQYDQTQYYIYTQFALRCRSLAVLLRSALAVTTNDAYGPALTLIRTAVEQVVTDKLAFLGKRYVQVFRQIDENVWKSWIAAREMGEAWTRDVVDWDRSRSGRVRIVREGFKSEPRPDGTTQTVGVHYFLMHGEYSPFVGPPSIQRNFDNGFASDGEMEEHAKEQQMLYNEYLKWSSMKDSLRSNGFADDNYLLHLDVHYRFLSAFTHPNTDVTPLLYGRNVHDWPRYDHYSSELVLLYASILATEELRNIRLMTQIEPTIEIREWSSIEGLCDQSSHLTAHLWFLGQQPNSYDRATEANRRYFRSITEEGTGTLQNPAEIPVEEISYYTNPLERLIRLHRGFVETTTGIVYQSPWPRNDAQYRI